MNSVTFYAKGHENILATHKNTLEFTKDEHVTLRGDCILAVSADFNYKEIANLIKTNINAKVTMQIENIIDSFTCVLNRDFCDDHELVFRLSDFKSDRTLGVRASKSAATINRQLIELLKDPNQKLKITLQGLD